MRGLAIAALAAAAAAVSCSDLPPIAPGCGNGFVDPGEECDGATAQGSCGAADDAVNGCHFVCATPADAPAAGCPDGFACGIDRRCRAPLGRFVAAPGPYAFATDQLTAGDVDGDGIDDLVGVDDDALSVRFGDSHGDLAAITSQPSRRRNGDAVFGHLDDNATLDVIIPTSAGLITFLADGHQFTPFPYTSLTLGPTALSATLAVVDPQPAFDSSFLLGAANTLRFTTLSTFTCIDGSGPNLAGNCLGAGARDVSQLLGDQIATGHTGFVLTADGSASFDADDPSTEFAIAFRGDPSIALWTSFADKAGVPQISQVQATIALEPGVRVGSDGAIGFGDVDGDGCVDIVIPVLTTVKDDAGDLVPADAAAIAHGERTSGACTGRVVSPAKVPSGITTAIPTDGTSSGVHVRAIADLNDDGIADVVADGGLVLSECVLTVCAYIPISATPRHWTSVVTGDFNQDGFLDLAAIVDGQLSVDVLLGTGEGVFNKFSVETVLPAKSLAVGDFDGDFVDDVAVAAGDPAAGSAEVDQIFVAFGQTSGGLTPAISMGKFGVLDPLLACQLQVDEDGLHTVSDLLVTANANGMRRVGPLIGEGSRRMFGPYTLSGGPQPVTAVIGELDGDTSHADVAAVAQGSGSGDVRFFVLSGVGGGDLAGAAAGVDSDLARFEATNAHWATGPLTAGASIDTIVAIDHSDAPPLAGSACSLLVATPPSGGTLPKPTLSPLPPPYGQAASHALRLVDLDGDGADELLVEMRAADGGVLSFTTSPAATAIAPLFSTATPTQCSSASPIEIGGGSGLELATVCRDSRTIQLLERDGSGWANVATLPLLIPGPRQELTSNGQLVTGDFNGDHLTDIAIITADQAVQVYLQCATVDDACADALEPQ